MSGIIDYLSSLPLPPPIVFYPLLSIGFLYLIYYKYLTAAHKKTPLQFFDNTSPEFLALRNTMFPPPFPNGWWKLCDVADLKNNRIQSVSALGLNLVVYQGKNGKIGVLDAFCPHLGAHLGMGQVIDNNIQCPFHAWEFDTDGIAVNIPYCTAPKLPSNAKTKKHIHTVYMGAVYLWFDAEGRPPTYDLRPLTNIEKNYVCYGTVQSHYPMHVAEMAENSADYFHFNFLHAPLPLPVIGRFFTVKFDTKLFFPGKREVDTNAEEEEEDANSVPVNKTKPIDFSVNENNIITNIPQDNKHISYFENWGTIHFCNIALPFTKQLTLVTFEGPSVIHFDIPTPLGHIHLLKTLLPIKPFQTYSEDTWYAEKRCPRWLVSIVIKIARGALDQDRIVWHNKIFNLKPALVKGDGPFPAHRRWFRQFYSSNSKKWAETCTVKNNELPCPSHNNNNNNGYINGNHSDKNNHSSNGTPASSGALATSPMNLNGAAKSMQW